MSIPFFGQIVTINAWPADFKPAPCPGCGMAYLTQCVNPMFPHDPQVCAAYYRGIETGKWLARQEIAHGREHDGTNCPSGCPGPHKVPGVP